MLWLYKWGFNIENHNIKIEILYIIMIHLNPFKLHMQYYYAQWAIYVDSLTV